MRLETVCRPTAEQLIALYNPMLFRVAYARTNSRTDAEDIVQETWMRYLRSGPAFETEEHRKAWLLRVCLNCSNSFLSSSWKNKTAPLEEDIPTESIPGGEASDLARAMGKLPEKYRKIIHLFYYEDLSVAEISGLLNIRQPAVKTQLCRARQMLKEELGGDYYDL